MLAKNCWRPDRLKRTININVNGKEYSGLAEPRTLLVYFLRDELGLTGTRIGCDTGHCGACTVLLNGLLVKSCMVLAFEAEDSKILTVEGLAENGKLHPIQEAFWENHGLECGYCTPGMLMATYYLLMKNPNPSEEDIRKAISGNMCMCTGYVNIVKSIKAAAETMRKTGFAIAGALSGTIRESE
jgi:carbon-monoxide dehydrogenase small subunit